MHIRDYKIARIDYDTAMRIIVKHHYLHRRAACSYAFGLFEPEATDHAGGLFPTEKLVGVICYGASASATLCAGLCGKAERRNVIELTRLWICDSVPKNGESYLIGNTLKMIDKEIIVSFAEIKQGHVGTVYQATNWLYTGLSFVHKHWAIEGLDRHNRTLTKKYSLDDLRRKIGDRVKLVENPRKHRYVFFNAKGKRKKELLKLLKYEVLPYPKLVSEPSLQDVDSCIHPDG